LTQCECTIKLNKFVNSNLPERLTVNLSTSITSKSGGAQERTYAP
jgi:hypothetical protein